MLRKFLSPTKKDSFNLKRAIKRTSSNLKMNESKLTKLLSDINFTETLDIHDIFKTSDIVNNPIYIDILDNFITQGLVLPESQSYNTETTSEYYTKIISNIKRLYITLRNKPELLNQQDENGWTLIHHGAHLGNKLDCAYIKIIHHILFTGITPDFTIKDKNGLTPLHIVSNMIYEKTTLDYVFPYYLEFCKKNNFDFLTEDNNGRTIIHSLVLSSNTGEALKIFFDLVGSIDLNSFSTITPSPLYYAVSTLSVEKVEVLLDHGLDPTKFGQHNPYELLKKMHIKNIGDLRKIHKIKKLIY